jgi:hypothetical protein
MALEDSRVRFLKSHFIGENPFLKAGDNWECRNDVVEMERIGIGEKPKPLASFEGKNDPRDFKVFSKDICPDRDKFLKCNGQPKVFLDGLKKLRRGYSPPVEIIDHAVFEIEEIGEYFFRFSKLFFLRKAAELLCNLVIVERKDDIAQVEENDLDHNPSHPSLPAPGRKKTRKGRRQEISPFLKGRGRNHKNIYWVGSREAGPFEQLKSPYPPG